MKLLSKLKQLSRKTVVLGVVTLALLGFGIFKSVQAQNIAINVTPECEANSVVWCGALSVNQLIDRYNNGDGHNSAKSIQDIYGYFKISSADINGMDDASTHVEAGRADINGNVYDASGKVVATDLKTAGRGFIAGSTPVTFNGTSFYVRPPSVSFRSNSIAAYVVKSSNGIFRFAVLASCGNPGAATPLVPKVPNYSINKQVAVKGSNTFAKNINVKPGTHVIYLISIRSTGDAPVTGLRVSDTLKPHISYVDNSLFRDNAKVADPTDNAFFTNTGITVGTLPVGGSTVFTFEAIVGPNDTPVACTNETLPNTGNMVATSLPPESSTATVSKQCAPKPAYACSTLTPTKLSRIQYNFTAKATATNGATITRYVFHFGDKTADKTVTTSSETATLPQPHTYPDIDTAQAYTTSVDVFVKITGVTGEQKAAVNLACSTQINVAGKPLAECTGLDKPIFDTTNPRKITVTAHFTTQNGAKLNSASFDWDDGQPPTVTNKVTNGNQVVADHAYKEDKDYTIKATLTFTGASNIPASECEVPLTVKTVPPTCDEFDLNPSDNRTVTVSKFHYTATQTNTFKNAVISWGDTTDGSNNTPITNPDTSQVIGKTSHTFAADGTYLATVVVHFTDKDTGGDIVATGIQCQKQVTFAANVPPKVTPPPAPEALLKTGPGNVIGMFSGITLAGAFIHRRFLSRRLAAEPSTDD
ncbi:MAG TPA: hypothetical protein VLG37_00080 [Candidatus Saccharimonadales bacterium]|nr:hypothetical protein [Candidatus Saccharimonadales bacterium]